MPDDHLSGDPRKALCRGDPCEFGLARSALGKDPVTVHVHDKALFVFVNPVIGGHHIACSDGDVNAGKACRPELVENSAIAVDLVLMPTAGTR